ncbi:hypothetical protein E3Q22_00527 [Wallemia mellicola]|uniref:DAGKc domain-containing protein n=1 Tax=Wallemia mellicola TaxID=1708541 RepID=A0A4T0Q1D4_9BASI|nr:hypothetical protein E3Q22_00527 [Wallemia mellicola]TIC17646.1 hypothetical protein E3Q15_00549 [Wallemia mellicola]
MIFQLKNEIDNNITVIVPDEEKGLTIRTSDPKMHPKKNSRSCTSCISKQKNYQQMDSDGGIKETHINYWRVVNCSLDQGIISLSVLTPGHNSLLDFSGIPIELSTEEVDKVVQYIRFKSKLRTCRRLKALVNPVGGTGKAVIYWNETVLPILRSSGCYIDMQILEYKGHAFEIAKKLLLNYDAVVCVSGDGIMHEVLNGFMYHETPSDALKTPLCPIPAGSGNGISVCVLGEKDGFDLSMAALNAAKGQTIPLDLFSIWQERKRTISYLTQAGGLMASLDVGTENLRWMGDTRFTVGYLRSLIKNAPCNCEVYVNVEEDNKHEMIKCLRERKLDDPISVPETDTFPPVKYKNGPEDDWVKISDDICYIYAGQVPWVSRTFKQFPVALPDDGYIDVAVQLNVSRRHKLLAMEGAENGAMFFDDSLKYYKAKAYHVNPINKNQYLAVDGEQLPPSPFTVEVLPSMGRLISPFNSWNNQF